MIEVDNINESKVLFIMPKTLYTEELADAICFEIACGDGVHKACEKHNIDPRVFFAWLFKNKDLQHNYMRARESRSDAHFEGSEQLMAELKAGKITSDQARIMLDEIKWKCAKQAPKKYSDKYTVAGDPEAPLVTANIDMTKLDTDTLTKLLAARRNDAPAN